MTDTTTFDKPEWRNTTLRCIREASDLWSSDGKLTCKYMEMIGLTGVAMFELLRPYLSATEDFMGVDNQLSVLMAHSEVPDLKVAYGDAYRIAVDAAKDDFGVFVFDGTDMGLPSWWRKHQKGLAEVVQHSVSKHGACVLVLNKTIGRGEGKPSDRLIRQAELLCSNLKWGLTPENLLGPGLRKAALLNSPTWTGWAGGYQIYRSNDRTIRMATLRLRFSNQRAHIFREN